MSDDRDPTYGADASPAPVETPPGTADSEVTQLRPTMRRDPRVDYVGPTPDGFFDPTWTGDHQALEEQSEDDGRDRSVLVPAIVLVLLLVLGGGALGFAWATGDDGADSEAQENRPPSPPQTPGPPDLSQGLLVHGPPTDKQILLVGYTFLDRIRNKDCDGALALGGPDPNFPDPRMNNIRRTYLCVPRVVSHVIDGFNKQPTLSRLGPGDFVLNWNAQESMHLRVIGDRLKVTMFTADLYS